MDTTLRKMPKTTPLLPQPYQCEHCMKKFQKERTFVLHVCEKKRRHEQRDEKRVQTGFLVYNKFYQMAYGQTQGKTYDEFSSSSLYSEFVKFGSFLNNAKIVEPNHFVEYLIKNNVKIDWWTRDRIYEKYLLSTLKTETVEAAVQRSLNTMMDWAEISESKFNLYFQAVNRNRAVQDIREGFVSPWVILNCQSGVDMIKELSKEQLNLISKILDIEFWLKTFKYRPDDVTLVEEICQEAGIP